MKIDETVTPAKQSQLPSKEEKTKTAEPTANSTKPSVATNDIVTLASSSELPKEMISKGNALDALAKVIGEMNTMPDSSLTSLHKQVDSEKVAQLLQA